MYREEIELNNPFFQKPILNEDLIRETNISKASSPFLKFQK